jgi:archaellum biogenesis ATPase FlaH
LRSEITGELDVNLIAEEWDFPQDEETSSSRTNEPRIQSISDVASIRTYASQRIEFLVEDLIAAGTVNVLTGESGAGKTTLVTAICAAVDRGEPFAGLVTQRRPVLILDRENPLPIVVERFDRLGIQDGENFHVWGGWATEEPPTPFAPIVMRWVKICDPKPLIVVDSLVSFHGGNENDATETRAYMHGFRRLADLGATIIVLHNSGKGESSKDYRGSSDIKASVDVAYHLANIGANPSRLELLCLKTFKARFTVQPETIFRCVGGRFRIDSRSPSQTKTDLLRQLLIANPGIKGLEFEALASDKGLGRDRARKFLKDSIDSGAVQALSGSFNTHFHTWVAPDTEDSY